MKKERTLIVALHERSFGRISIALGLADDLKVAGMEVTFVIHPSLSIYPAARGYPVIEISDNLGPLVELVIKAAFNDVRPHHVVLCDFFGNCNALHRCGLGAPEFLLDWPCISLDLWDSDLTGAIIDRADGSRAPLCHGAGDRCWEIFHTELPRVVPSPFAASEGATPRVQAMPQPLQRRRENRKEKRVLTTTAAWQSTTDRRATQVALPDMLARAFAALPSLVRWDHVGPVPFTFKQETPPFYHFHRQMPQDKMKLLLEETDVFLSLNASASVMMQALFAGIPTILLKHSRADGGYGSFALWPLGYDEFLKPLMAGNLIYDAMRIVDIAPQGALLEALAEALFLPECAEIANAKAKVLRQSTRKLPTLADHLRSQADVRLKDISTKKEPMDVD